MLGRSLHSHTLFRQVLCVVAAVSLFLLLPPIVLSGASASTVSAPAEPGAPSSVATTAYYGGVGVTWASPDSAGSPITGYVITPYVGSAAETPVQIGGSASTTSYIVWGLTNGTAYSFTVAAVNANGTGPASAPSASAIPFGAPSPPPTVTAQAGNASAVVTWTPGSDNGSPITSYVVTPYAAWVAQTPQTFLSTATSQTITGLTNGTYYTFTVSAVNAAGTGQHSSGSSPVTPSSLPGTPSSVATTPHDGSVTVWWTAPPTVASPLASYVVTAFSGGTQVLTQTVSPSFTATDVDGLTDGLGYSFIVAAVNGIGTGPSSAGSAVVVPAATPYTFDDEFTGAAGAGPNTGLSENYWLSDGCWTSGCGNSVPTEYAASNAHLDGSGDLVLQADSGSTSQCGPVACQFTSGALTMTDWSSTGPSATWSQEYGTFSARMKLPTGAGLWPAFWLTGSDISNSTGPVNGEIDIVEALGQAPTMASGHAVGGDGGTATSGGAAINLGSSYALPDGGTIDGWHVYSITWSPYGIEWTIDGATVLTLSPAQIGSVWAQSFQHPFTLHLDLAVGGPAGATNATTVLPADMLVDWVRVTN